MILPKNLSCRESALGRITRESHTPIYSLLHTLLKDKCMGKLKVTRHAGQVQYIDILLSPDPILASVLC